MKKTEAAARAAGGMLGSSGGVSGPSAGGPSGSSSTTSTSKTMKKSACKSPNLSRRPDSGGKGEGGGVTGGAGVSGSAATSVGGGSVVCGGVVGALLPWPSSYPTGPGASLHPSGATSSGTYESSLVTVSVEDLDTVDGGSSRENGGSESMTTTAQSDEGSLEGQGSDGGDTHKTRAAMEHLKAKIEKTKDLIRKEQNQKESNVNEYLQLAASADKQQNQRIKTLFEKRNQKSAQCINHLQKKLENYQKRLQEIETHGVSTGHKQAKEVLRDVGQGLKDVGANIFDGISGFSGTIVSKPKEFAHLIKNRFGSADNITQMKMEDTITDTESQQPGRTGGTLPASFKYGSDDENSSMTSGSGYGVGVQSSPVSGAQGAAGTQSSGVVAQAVIETMREDLNRLRETSRRLEDSLNRLMDEFDSFKSVTQSEMSQLRSLLEEEKFRVERLEDQMNDLTELHQNEMANVKQDMASMEEKIEYRLDERTTDLSDLVDNCQTRILRLEQQQQQQQLLSMEMVENVTFRTILTKLINVILALLAVVLVFVSTAANLLSPFLTSRMRILSTAVLVLVISLLWTYGGTLIDFLLYLWDSVTGLFVSR